MLLEVLRQRCGTIHNGKDTQPRSRKARKIASTYGDISRTSSAYFRALILRSGLFTPSDPPLQHACITVTAAHRVSTYGVITKNIRP